MSRWTFMMLVVLGCGCRESAPVQEEARSEAPPGKPEESRPLRRGFTQRPAPDTPGLPPSIPPLLSADELERARTLALERSDESEAAAQRELSQLVEAFEREPDEGAVKRLRDAAVEMARSGRIPFMDIEDLYAEYLFPNPVAEADAKYEGKIGLFSGMVAPHNMRDFADGFKLFEQDPYVHDPLLLATDYELSFVECRLVRPAVQKLKDWQPIHFVAEVEGKRAGDLLLGRCVVI